MGVPVMIMGESGAGKTCGLRNFKKGEILVLSVASKPLPFRSDLDVINQAGYKAICGAIAKGGYKSYCIDDSQYLMVFENFMRTNENGYKKYTDIAINFYNLIKAIIEQMPPDTIVYFLHHTQTDEEGKIKAKTVGKMIDSQLTLEGLFSIVLMCQSQSGKHVFITQSDGTSTAKSPMDMFPAEIENDIKLVDTKIREYYNL